MIYLYVNIFKILINNTLKSNKKIKTNIGSFYFICKLKKKKKIKHWYQVGKKNIKK
jgi:hypothetical protein